MRRKRTDTLCKEVKRVLLETVKLKKAKRSRAPVFHTYNPSYLGTEIRRIAVQGHSDPISKIIRVKWTRGVTQAVECLICKCEALFSNPSLTINK
jgi:hypothetical protein